MSTAKYRLVKQNETKNSYLHAFMSPIWGRVFSNNSQWVETVDKTYKTPRSASGNNGIKFEWVIWKPSPKQSRPKPTNVNIGTMQDN